MKRTYKRYTAFDDRVIVLLSNWGSQWTSDVDQVALGNLPRLTVRQIAAAVGHSYKSVCNRIDRVLRNPFNGCLADIKY